MRRQIAAASCLAIFGAWRFRDPWRFPCSPWLNNKPRRLGLRWGAPTKVQTRPHRQCPSFRWRRPALPVTTAWSTPPSRSSWNPSSIRLPTRFGKRWEPLWIKRAFTSRFLRRRRSGSMCVVPRSGSSRGANLLMMPGREAAPRRNQIGDSRGRAGARSDHRAHKEESKGFRCICQGIAGCSARRPCGPATPKNAALLMDIGARMENVCESCHQTFWYPLEKHAP